MPGSVGRVVETLQSRCCAAWEGDEVDTTWYLVSEAESILLFIFLAPFEGGTFYILGSIQILLIC